MGSYYHTLYKLNTLNITIIVLKIELLVLQCMRLNASGIAYSVNPDQTASLV